MQNLYYDVRVDIKKAEALDSGYRFTRGDRKKQYLRIAVLNGSSKFDATGTTPEICFLKPDGTLVTGIPTESGDVWIYEFVGNELQASGKVLCDLKFAYDSGRVSTCKFTFMVEVDTTSDTAVKSTSYITDLEKAKKQATEIVEGIIESEAAGTGYAAQAADSASQAAVSAEQAAESAAQAVRGSRITQGTAITGTSAIGTVFPDSGIQDAIKYDMYINTADGNTYQCTKSGAAADAEWVYTGSIQGGGSDAWDSITKKPFDTIGSDGLIISPNGLLDVDFGKVQPMLQDATTTTSGTMSPADKAKLNGIAPNANNYSLPAASSAEKGGAKITGTDGLTMDGEVLKAAVKGLIDNENDFNAQTTSTGQAADSELMKRIIDKIIGMEIPGNLPASATSITFTDAAIVTDGSIEWELWIDSDDLMLTHTAAAITTGSMTFTFPAQTVDVPMRLKIREV